MEHIVEGDSVEDVLAYVQYDKHSLIAKVRDIIDRAKSTGQISASESSRLLERYERALDGYTYLSSTL